MTFRPRTISEEEFTEMQQRVGKHNLVDRSNALNTNGNSRILTQKQPVSSTAYKSKWDEAYGYVMVMEKRCGLIKDFGYETMTLKLAKGKYHRPDYTVWHNDGTIELRQIKGYHKNIRASLTALKWAAQKHPWYLFTLWRKQGSGWESHQVEI